MFKSYTSSVYSEGMEANWTVVSEEMPKKGVLVLTWSEYGGYHLMMWRGDEDDPDWYTEDEILFDVVDEDYLPAYWMPLPEEPE